MIIKKTGLMLLMCLIALYSFGQHEVGLQAGLQLPYGGLSNIYNPTVGFELSYFNTYKKSLGSVSIGYVNFQPKESIFYFEIPPDVIENFTEVGTATFSNYIMIPIAAEFHWLIKQSKRAKAYPYVGFSMSAIYFNIEYDVHSRYINSSTGFSYFNYGLAPIAGYILELNKNMKVFAETKYQMILNRADDLDFTFTNEDNNAGLFDFFQSYDVGVRFYIF